MIQTVQQGVEMGVQVFVGIDLLGFLSGITFGEDLKQTKYQRVEELGVFFVQIDENVFGVEREEIENDLHLIAVVVIEVQEIENGLQSGMTVFEQVDDLSG